MWAEDLDGSVLSVVIEIGVKADCGEDGFRLGEKFAWADMLMVDAMAAARFVDEVSGVEFLKLVDSESDWEKIMKNDKLVYGVWKALTSLLLRFYVEFKGKNKASQR